MYKVIVISESGVSSHSVPCSLREALDTARLYRGGYLWAGIVSALTGRVYQIAPEKRRINRANH